MSRGTTLQLALALLLSTSDLRAAVAADAPMPIAHKTADYEVALRGGRAQEIVVHVRDGGRIVLGDLVGDEGDRQDEQRAFAAGGCASGPCRSTCAFAASVRPFRSVTRLDASGRPRWAWRVPDEGVAKAALKLIASGGDDCLSPDGGYAAVAVFGQDGAGGFTARLGPSVLRLSPRPGFVPAQGLGGATDAVVGWRADAPATLVVEHDAGVQHDGPPEYVETHFEGDLHRRSPKT